MILAYYSLDTYNFNPRSHEGSDLIQEVKTAKDGLFQSTLPRGERLTSTGIRCLIKRNFNPRSHEGSDRGAPAYSRGRPISIHAPTRGATISQARWTELWQFQSTLPRGERLNQNKRNGHSFLYFNPRSHEGSDKPPRAGRRHRHISIHAPTRGATTGRLHQTDRSVGISIHAPTRGATGQADLKRGQDDLFQSTLPRGERPDVAKNVAEMSPFQSTLPRGERPMSPKMSPKCRHFNPRSHEGSDRTVTYGSAIWSPFQSTLPRGERLLHQSQSVYRLSFQSTLPRGERRHDPAP